MGVTVVNPLQFLRELFTINGAGTLIRRGSRIDVHDGWQSVDPVRLRALFASAFGRDIRDDFFTRPIARTFVEENYRGAAVVAETAVAPYLTKFAVERQAQGDGLGSEIWSLVTRDYPAFFWRSRPENPITAWYVKQCDGLAPLPQVAHLLARPAGRDDRPGGPARARRRERLRLGLRADELTDLAGDRAHVVAKPGSQIEPCTPLGKALTNWVMRTAGSPELPSFVFCVALGLTSSAPAAPHECSTCGQSSPGLRV